MSTSKRAVNRDRWQQRIEAWKASGQSQRAFCVEQGLGLATFARWRGIFKLNERDGDSTPQATPVFVPVTVRDSERSGIRVVLEDGLHIEVNTGFDPRLLHQVVQVLRAR